MGEAIKKTNELVRQRYILDLHRLLYKTDWRLKMAYKALSDQGVGDPKGLVEKMLREDYRELVEGMDNKKKRAMMNQSVEDYAKETDKRIEDEIK